MAASSPPTGRSRARGSSPGVGIDADSIRSLTTQDGSSPTSILVATALTKLGLRGRWALLFHGTHDPLAVGGGVPTVGFWTFESSEEPTALVHAVAHAMSAARVPGAANVAARALPPTVLTTKTMLG